jgi:hypothetical protein
MTLIKIEKCGHCFYCIYRDIIEYRDNFLDNNREMIFLISPNPTLVTSSINIPSLRPTQQRFPTP